MRYLSALALALFAVSADADKSWDISDLKVAKPEDKEDAKGTPPPKGAVVLFDGKNLDNWTKDDGKTPAKWKQVDGGAMQVNGTGNIITKEKFDGRFKLHVEFRVPHMPKATGQGRGNSGVYVQGRYEVQVLDSYGLPPRPAVVLSFFTSTLSWILTSLCSTVMRPFLTFLPCSHTGAVKVMS